MVEVSLYIEAYASRMLSFLPETGSQTMPSGIASPPEFASYKLL
jgi:hypothetical protein